MYMLVREYKPKAGSSCCESTVFGLCSCGAKFKLNRVKDSYYIDKEYDTTAVCPNCGAPYGRFAQDVYLCRWDGTILDEADIKKKAALTSLSVDGDTVTLHREVPDFESFTSKHFSIATSSKVIFSTDRGLRIEKVEIDSKEVKLNGRNLSKALSYVTVSSLPMRVDCKDFVVEIRALSTILDGTTSVHTIAKNLLKYPVLDSLYHEVASTDRTNTTLHHLNSAFKRAIEDEVLKPNERSIKKAFGLPKQLIDPVFKLYINTREAQELNRKVGPDVTVESVKTALEIFGENTSCYIGELVAFLAERTPAERKRLVTYLTEEVSIYQGIEKPKEAWDLLKDYIRMCVDMNVPYVLCPKSLKLQHDLVSMNYKVVLSEREKAKFKEVVSSPEYKNLGWVSKDKKWAVITPQDSVELVREGKEQSHCVGSYISFVTSGKFKICFLRRTENIMKPVLTLTVNKENVCSMYLGFDNRHASDEEIETLKEWTKAKNLKLG